MSSEIISYKDFILQITAIVGWDATVASVERTAVLGLSLVAGWIVVPYAAPCAMLLCGGGGK